jgi:Na+/H+-dicarboxylate symporter
MIKLIKQNLPIKLMLMILLVSIFGVHVSADIKSFCLALSLSMKEVLVFLLPFIIFSFLFSSFSKFSGNILLFVGTLLGVVCFSNFISTMVGYTIAFVWMPDFSATVGQMTEATELFPLWHFSLPKYISNEWALFSGFLVGIIASISKNETLGQWSEKMKMLSNLFLNKIFVPLVPLFILGFIFKMEYEGSLRMILKSYSSVLGVLILVYVLYLFILYFLGCGCNLQKTIRSIRNAFPAGLMGFSTMSSAAAMPLTFRAGEQNTGNEKLVKVVTPTTASIHLVGDSIGVPLISLTILLAFGYPFPDLSAYLVFVLYFILAKFAVSAVPGGGMVVMLPYIQKYLGFNDPMLALIMAIYLLFDPIFTSTNVMGNNAFLIIFNRLIGKKV